MQKWGPTNSPGLYQIKENQICIKSKDEQIIHQTFNGHFFTSNLIKSSKGLEMVYHKKDLIKKRQRIRMPNKKELGSLELSCKMLKKRTNSREMSSRGARILRQHSRQQWCYRQWVGNRRRNSRLRITARLVHVELGQIVTHNFLLRRPLDLCHHPVQHLCNLYIELFWVRWRCLRWWFGWP